jgi:hypothetical protein
MTTDQTTKSLFKSKSALAGVLTSLLGAASAVSPSIGAWVGEHMAVILGVVGLLSVILRMVTSGRVEIFPEDK